MHSRPDYIQRRIDFALQRQRHAREAAPDCGCPLCLADRGELIDTIKRLNATAPDAPRIPF
jgi:hypothetical protein